MTASDAHRALRTGAAYARHDTSVAVWLRGEDARAAALATLTSRLLLRDGQAQQALLLDRDARPIADVTVCADDEDYLLVVDGLSPSALLAHLHEETAHLSALTIEDASRTHEVLSLHGPFAWELVAEVLGQDLMALPYLNFFRIDQGIALRSGVTGEFGYELVVRRELADELDEKIATHAAQFDGARLSPEDLALARFEGWFFDPRYVPEGASPLELQLQWRLAGSRDFVGRAAIEARRARAASQPGLSRKLVCVLLSRDARHGAALSIDGENVGTIFRAAGSPMGGVRFASALVSATYAHGSVELDVEASGRARIIAPPILDNRSLHVDPRRHAYRTRDEIPFGPFTRHLPILEPG